MAASARQVWTSRGPARQTAAQQRPWALGHKQRQATATYSQSYSSPSTSPTTVVLIPMSYTPLERNIAAALSICRSPHQTPRKATLLSTKQKCINHAHWDAPPWPSYTIQALSTRLSSHHAQIPLHPTKLSPKANKQLSQAVTICAWCGHAEVATCTYVHTHMHAHAAVCTGRKTARTQSQIGRQAEDYAAAKQK